MAGERPRCGASSTAQLAADEPRGAARRRRRRCGRARRVGGARDRRGGADRRAAGACGRAARPRAAGGAGAERGGAAAARRRSRPGRCSRPGGCSAARCSASAAALTGPAAVVGVVRARRARYRDELRRGAAGAARALADAIAAGHSVRGALAEVAPTLPGAAGHELRIAARSLALGEPTEAVLERLRARAATRAWDTLVAAILLQRDAGGDLPALLRELAAALEAARPARARRPRGDRPGALHRLARRRPARSPRPRSPSSPRPASSARSSPRRCPPPSPRSRSSSRRPASWRSTGSSGAAGMTPGGRRIGRRTR